MGWTTGRRRGAGRLIVATGLLAGTVLLTSCTSGPALPPSTSFGPSATRADPGPLRSDEQPLTGRFAALGDPLAVAWRSGTTGDPAVPGPSTYWIDAAVQVQPATAATLAATSGLTPAELPADLPADVRAAAGDGPWRSGEALNEAFGTAGFGTQAFIAGDVVVLRAVGSGEPG